MGELILSVILNSTRFLRPLAVLMVGKGLIKQPPVYSG